MNSKKCFSLSVLVALLVCLFSCHSSSTPSTSSTEETRPLLIYEPTALPEAEAGVRYESADPSSLILEGNQVVGLHKGTADVFAKKDGQTLATYHYEISDDGEVPYLSLSPSSLSLFVGSSFPLSPSFSLRGKTLESVFSYQSEDAKIAEVEGTTLRAISEGDTTIHVSAAFYSLEPSSYPFLSENVRVRVATSKMISLSASTLSLSTRKLTTGSQSFTNEATLSGVYLDASGAHELPFEETTFVSSDPTLLSVSGGKVVGLKAGTATLYASYQGVQSSLLSFTISKPLLSNLDKVVDIDLAAGDFTLDTSSFLTGDVSILGVYDSASPEKNLFQNGKLSSELSLGSRHWRVESELDCYALEVVVASKILRNVDELRSLLSYGVEREVGNFGVLSFRGYFLLGQDLDFEGASFRNIVGIANGATNPVSSGFKGTFDGCGHTLSNVTLTADNGGLFGTLAVGSVIKNLAFKNAIVKGNSGLLTSLCGGRVENCYIEGYLSSVSGTASLRSSLLGGALVSGASIDHVVVNYLNPLRNAPFAAPFGYFSGAEESSLSNCFVIGTTSRVFSTAVSEVYSAFTKEDNGQFADYSSFKKGADLSSFGSSWEFGESGILFHA
jgi:hypothetical protein